MCVKGGGWRHADGRLAALPFILGAGGEDDVALEMAFSKKKVDERKQWLQGFAPGTFLDHSFDTISYSDFVHKVCRGGRLVGGARRWALPPPWGAGLGDDRGHGRSSWTKHSERGSRITHASPPLLPPLSPPLQELILFSRADLERSIPNMVDGLKPGQRKIMFACFKRNLKTDVKVAQLAGYVAEHSGAAGQGGSVCV